MPHCSWLRAPAASYGRRGTAVWSPYWISAWPQPGTADISRRRCRTSGTPRTVTRSASRWRQSTRWRSRGRQSDQGAGLTAMSRQASPLASSFVPLPSRPPAAPGRTAQGPGTGAGVPGPGQRAACVPNRPPQPSYAAQHCHHLAEDGRIVTGDRLVRGVVREEPDVAVLALEALDRGLAFQHGRHDVAVLGDGLAADRDPVAVADRGLDHGVADDLQHEQFAVTDQLAGEREDVLDRLLGEDRATGGDAADQWHVRRGGLAGGVGRLHGGALVGAADLVRARTVRVAAQEALPLQRHQLVCDRRGAGQPHGLADL